MLGGYANMNRITLISPYFGEKFPSNFKVLLDLMKNNKNIKFIIPTNINCEDLMIPNIVFVKTDLEHVKKSIEDILGYEVTLNTPYKLVDFKPMYGVLFKEYIKNSEWWGYFDMDIIFGNISHFLTDSVLNEYDRIFSHGHLTLFKNTEYMNMLWNKDFKLSEVPCFKVVATSNAIFAFDEWGWGKNKGRGLSYALDKKININQYNNQDIIADIKKDYFKFYLSNKNQIEYFIYLKGNLEGILTDSTHKEFLYAHFQKRSLIDSNSDVDQAVYIKPNVISNKLIITDEVQEELRWSKDIKRRKRNQKFKNLNIDYLKRRVMFLNSEK